MNDYNKEILALEEIRQIHESIYEIGDVLDGKAMSLLSNSSLILTLFGILQISFNLGEQSTPYFIGLGSVIAFFLLLVGIVMHMIMPKDYRLVFEASWEGIEKAILLQDGENVFIQLIANYLARIQNNREINRKKNIWLRLATWIFIAILVLMFTLSISAAI